MPRGGWRGKTTVGERVQMHAAGTAKIDAAVRIYLAMNWRAALLRQYIWLGRRVGLRVTDFVTTY